MFGRTKTAGHDVDQAVPDTPPPVTERRLSRSTAENIARRHGIARTERAAQLPPATELSRTMLDFASGSGAMSSVTETAFVARPAVSVGLCYATTSGEYAGSLWDYEVQVNRDRYVVVDILRSVTADELCRRVRVADDGTVRWLPPEAG